MKLNKVIYFLVIVFIVNPISLYSKNIEEIVVTGTKVKHQSLMKLEIYPLSIVKKSIL